MTTDPRIGSDLRFIRRTAAAIKGIAALFFSVTVVQALLVWAIFRSPRTIVSSDEARNWTALALDYFPLLTTALAFLWGAVFFIAQQAVRYRVWAIRSLAVACCVLAVVLLLVTVAVVIDGGSEGRSLLTIALVILVICATLTYVGMRLWRSVWIAD
jgi:hypothetical protein